MKVLSFQAKSNSCDEIPLNESFESIGTSDQFVEIGNDSGSNVEPITTLWSLTGIQNHRRPSFASTETLKVRNSARSIPLPATSLYSASLSAMLDASNDFSDEPEPRAIVMPRPPICEPQYSSDECKSEFFDNMIAMKSDLNRRWKFEASSAQEERNIVATDTVWVEKAEFVPYDKESPEDRVDETRAHAIAMLHRVDEHDASNNCNEIVWKAWGCNDLTTRRHMMCFMFLLFLVILVVAVLIGIKSVDEPAQRVSAANRPQNPDDDAWTDNRPSEETPNPKPPLTNVPRPTPPQSPMSPTESPIPPTTGAESPRPPTRQPAVSPSKGPSMSTPSQTIAPITPTVKPSLTTQTPTKAQRESTSSPSGQPSICQSSISVAKSCYTEDDRIVINFVNCSPTEGDWIGIWRTREDPESLSEDFLGWAWTCGTQSCQRSPVSKRIAIDAYGLGFESFTAFLVHDKAEGAPYAIEAMSEPFIVTNFCRD